MLKNGQIKKYCWLPWLADEENFDCEREIDR